MSRLETREYAYATTVRGMCRSCRQVAPARVFFRDGMVWQESLCPCSAHEPALIAASQEWYLSETQRVQPDRSPLKGSHRPRKGCPHDCGPCAWHATPCQLPVISVTNACNLRCPICFTYNRPDRIYHMPVDHMRKTVDWIIESSGNVDLINITGGEPTLHPDILELLRACKRPEIGRVTMNSNGVRLAQDTELCAALAELGVCVILSFNTFDSGVSRQIHGDDLVTTKLKAIENLTAAGARIGLLYVMIRGLNTESAHDILKLFRENKSILSLTVQTMTYTGQGGGTFEGRKHIPVDEAARLLCDASQGELEFSDFLPRPSAHPLCYLTSYLLRSGDKLLPFARFASREKIAGLMTDSYLIRMDQEYAFFREIIDDLYARGEIRHLRVFRSLVEQLFPPVGAGVASATPETTGAAFERQRVAESCVRTIYVHAHMDEDTFDCSRAMMCPDLVPAEPGRLIPACTYNLLYRRMDDRFYVE